MNASDEKEIQSLDDLEELQLRRRKRFYKDALSAPSCRAVLWDIIEDVCNIWGSSYTLSDPYHTSFLEGKRNAGQDVVEIIQDADPQMYNLMVKEATERKSLDMEKANIVLSKHDDT